VLLTEIVARDDDTDAELPDYTYRMTSGQTRFIEDSWLLRNDSDIWGVQGGGSLTVVATAGSSTDLGVAGSVTRQANGFQFTAGATWSGQITFSYTITQQYYEVNPATGDYVTVDYYDTADVILHVAAIDDGSGGGGGEPMKKCGGRAGNRW
jgi:hypothetical protein